MKRISYSPEARQDLLILKNNLSFEYGEITAKKILTKITKSIRMLGFYDNAGTDVSESTGKACNYKYFFTTKNYIFYRIIGNVNTKSGDSEDIRND